jgi:hypothetical protein
MIPSKSGAGRLIGLGAATGAVGVAALMSTATAPSARADDFTDTIAVVEAEYAAGQGAFTAAFTDFAGNHLATGTAAVFDGLDDDFVAAPNLLVAGTVEGLTKEAFDLTVQPFDFSVPATFADGLSAAQQAFADGQNLLNAADAALSAGQYGDAAYFDLLGGDFLSIIPLQEVMLGSLAGM